MKKWRGRAQPLDLTSDSHVRNAARLTQARRRLFKDLIGIREMRRISQAQVARAIGIDRSGVSRFEADIESGNPTFDVILRYAHAVGAAIHMRAEPVEVAEDGSYNAASRFHRPLSAPVAAGFVVSAPERRATSWRDAVGVLSVSGVGSVRALTAPGSGPWRLADGEVVR